MASAGAPRGGVTIRLDPALGDALPVLEAQLARYPYVAIGEPADYALTSDGAFPQTLLLVNVAEPESAWRLVFVGADPMPSRKPRTWEIGNLLLGDYRAGLDAALRRIGKARALAALAGSAEEKPPLVCIGVQDAPARDPACLAGRGDGADMPPLFPESRLRLAVRNDAARPRYLTLLAVGPDDAIRAVLLPGDTPTAAGGQVEAAGALPLDLDGAHALVAIASARPLSAAMRDASGFVDTDPAQCTGTLGQALCGLAQEAGPPGQEADWSVTVVRLAVQPSLIQPIGGGIPVTTFMAPWMAELYSTIPYSAAEIAADDALPPDKKQYLRERSPAERNHRCGGTLIGPGLVLTAAHCVAKGNFEGDGAGRVLQARRVRLGTHGLGWGGTTYAIDAVAVHAGYRADGQADDIALLRVRADRGTDAGMTAMAPAMPERAPRLAGARAPVAAYGWGFTRPVAPGARALVDVSGDVQRNPDILQMGALERLDWKACRQRVGAVLGEGMLCAVPRAQAHRNVFSCVGDSGGPLMRSEGGRDVVVGVASWSMGCGYANFPSVYTDVGKYAGWIAAARAGLRPGSVVRIGGRPISDR